MSGNNISKGEKLCRDFFRFFYQKEKVFYNYRPDWLRFKGSDLELDIFYPRLKLAVEFQGIHHQIKSQKERDEHKKAVCDEFNIKLFCVSDILQLYQIQKSLNLPSPSIFIRKEIGKYYRACQRINKKKNWYVKNSLRRIGWENRLAKLKKKTERYKWLQNLEIQQNKARREKQNGAV